MISVLAITRSEIAGTPFRITARAFGISRKKDNNPENYGTPTDICYDHNRFAHILSKLSE